MWRRILELFLCLVGKSALSVRSVVRGYGKYGLEVDEVVGKGEIVGRVGDSS